MASLLLMDLPAPPPSAALPGRFPPAYAPRFLGKGCTGLVFGVHPRETSSDARIAYPPGEVALKMMLNELSTNQTGPQRVLPLALACVAQPQTGWHAPVRCFSGFPPKACPTPLASAYTMFKQFAVEAVVSAAPGNEGS